jgi:citrate lyase beta subunit
MCRFRQTEPPPLQPTETGVMLHFAHLAEQELTRLFHRRPEPFNRETDPELLAVALGATLYSPATRPSLAKDLVRQAGQGVTSAVVCLEDAVADEDLPAAELNAVRQLRELGASGAHTPMVFVRVRNVEQITMVITGLGAHLRAVTGFVIPKFTAQTGAAYLDTIADASVATGQPLFAMPVLESREVIYRQSRTAALLGIQQLLDARREHVLAVRIGATDLSGAYGLRRPRDLTIYDVHLVAEVIADVVNILGRADGSGFVVTGPVWEHFSGSERIFKPQLRESPFIAHEERPLRARLVAADLDGLIREVILDRANGLTGKTVIHPTHVAAVHALSVVTHEEYSDAQAILGPAMAGGGVAASVYRNKMNEGKPHRGWALRTMRRAQVFGVARAEVSFVDLLGASIAP